jgi:tetrahedral aminopeptidase
LENLDLLKRLCETPGVPGREERVRALIEKEIEGLFESVETDPMGNLICRRMPREKISKGKGKSKGGALSKDGAVPHGRDRVLCHGD